METVLDMKNSMAHTLLAYTSQVGVSYRARAVKIHADVWDVARSERKIWIPR
jgi:hypothetical protein